jgi:hypothetical protein
LRWVCHWLTKPETCNTGHQDQQYNHLNCIHTLHPESTWLTQKNCTAQQQNCHSTAKENLHLPSSCQGCLGIKTAGCIQHPMWMWQGLYWTKWSIYQNQTQRTQYAYTTSTNR